MVRRIVIHTLVVLFILVLGLSPLIAALIAGAIAEAHGCTLHEGFVNPCVIDGVDRGQDLYTFGMLGWLAIGTIPAAVIVAGGYLVVVIAIALVQSIRRRRAAQAQTLIPPS